jgi:hypothetical protein
MSKGERPLETAELISPRFVLIIERTIKSKKPLKGTLCDLRSERELPLGEWSSKSALRATARSRVAIYE